MSKNTCITYTPAYAPAPRRSREKDEEQRPFEVDGKEILSNLSKQARAKAGEKMDKKGRAVSALEAWWQESNIKCAVSEEYASCWVH